MVNELNLSFKKLILLITLTVILGISLVYGLSYEFAPESSPQRTRETSGSSSSGSSSSGSSSSGSAPAPGLAILADGHLRVFAYYAVEQPDGSYQGGFVQSSVAVIGPENFTGTAATDVQNPLTFTVNKDGRYSVLGTYGSLPPQNVTIQLGMERHWYMSNGTLKYGYNDTGWFEPLNGGYFWVVLNFGSSPPPPVSTISVSAYYESLETGWAMEYENGSWKNVTTAGGSWSLVEASVVITGPENFTGITIANTFNPLTFTVVPGQYSVTVTYDSLPPQNETINVRDGDYCPVTVWLGSGPLPP
jgi:hypothetical protein